MPVGNPVTDLSTSGNFVPVTRTLTINGVSYDLSADRSWSIASPGGGSVTSVAMTVPTGFTVTGSPITTAGTLAVTFASGYALPTTVKQSNWDDAYTFVSNFPSQTGNNGKFLYTSGSVLSWQPALQNPMSNYGEMIFGGTSGVPSVITPNSSTTKLYLQQVGNGTTPFAPSWGGIISSDITGAALTKTDDTNVTLTLGGTPGNSVLNAVSLTLGWTGQLSAGRGGTGTSGVTGIMLGNSTAPVTGVTGIGGQILRANPSTGAYEFWTPTYMENPMTQLGDIIAGNNLGIPVRIGANQTANSMYLRSVSGGGPAWVSIQGSHIVGAAITTANDTNITITASGNTGDALLRTLTLTSGWTGQLSPQRGGTGASTITGVVIGNGIGTMTGVAGTANQLLRRDATNSFYEFFTPTYISNPMNTLGDIIVGNNLGIPARLGANATSINKYLRSVNATAPTWEQIAGSDVTGAAVTTSNDTNILITASGNTTNALLRTMTLTAGWTGQLAVGRGGSGASTLTGVLIGNGTSAFTGVTGTASQILRRNAGNTGYEFFTASLLTSSGTTNFVPIWTSSSVLGNSPLSITGSEANFGSNKLVAGNVSATDGSIMLQDNYSTGHLGNIGTMYSGGNLMMGYCVTPSTSSATGFVSATSLDTPKSSIVIGTDIFFYTASSQAVTIGSAVSMTERFKLTNNGQLRLSAYTSTSSFPATLLQGFLGFTSTGAIVTAAIPGGISGTQNYLSKFDSSGTAIINTRIIDDGTNFLFNGASANVTGLNLIGNISATDSSGVVMNLRRSGTPTSGLDLAIIDAYGITTGSTYQRGAGIEFKATENWSATNAGTEVVISTTPNNTIAPADMFVFQNNGTVRFIGRTSNPIGAAAGTMYYNSSANNMRYFNGTTWITF